MDNQFLRTQMLLGDEAMAGDVILTLAGYPEGGGGA